MSTFRIDECTCGLCGHKFKNQVITSTNCFGSPDLDLRPAEMQRSTMPLWVTECPACGYASSEIELDGKAHKEFVASEEYKTCYGAKLPSSLAYLFFKQALILLREQNTDDAYDAFLHAAWECDDQQDEEAAVFCRNKAIETYDYIPDKPLYLRLSHIDLIRRAKRFEEAVAFCDKFFCAEPEGIRLISYQKYLALSKDKNCHLYSECKYMYMALNDEPFELIKQGKKTIEVRCNDEKRRGISAGDKIVFYKKSDPKETVTKTVKEVKTFNSFEQLYSLYPSENFGYENKTTEEFVCEINKIYDKEEQKKYKALAIILG